MSLVLSVLAVGERTLPTQDHTQEGAFPRQALDAGQPACPTRIHLSLPASGNPLILPFPWLCCPFQSSSLHQALRCPPALWPVPLEDVAAQLPSHSIQGCLWAAAACESGKQVSQELMFLRSMHRQRERSWWLCSVLSLQFSELQELHSSQE